MKYYSTILYCSSVLSRILQTPFLDMKLPPCNSWTKKAYGIAIGLTTQVISHSPTPFLLEHLRELFFDFLCQCTDFLKRPTFLADFQTFTDHVRFRIAQWNAPTLQPCRVLYVCASTEPLFWNIYRIMNPDDNTAYTWYVHGFPVQLSPFPPAATPPKNTKKAPFPCEPEKHYIYPLPSFHSSTCTTYMLFTPIASEPLWILFNRQSSWLSTA
jgi:hypothetical protein